MKPILILLLLTIAGCSNPYEKAQKITRPITKKVEVAKKVSLRIGQVAARQEKLIAEQSGSVGRLKGNADLAAAIAARLDAERPTADTKALVLALTAVKTETTAIQLSTHDLADQTVKLKADHAALDLAHEQVDTAVVQATGKVAVQIEKKEKAESHTRFWIFMFLGLASAITALFYFKTYLKTVPFIGPVISWLLP